MEKQRTWISDREATHRKDSAVIRRMKFLRETKRFLFYEDKNGDIWMIRHRNLKLKVNHEI